MPTPSYPPQLVHTLQGRHLTLNSSFPDSGLISVVVDATSSCFAGVSQCHKDSLVFSVCSERPIGQDQGLMCIHTDARMHAHTYTEILNGVTT